MSSDLYVQSLARGKMLVRRRKHVSGEVQICFNDPAITPIIISTDQVVDITATGIGTNAIQRSNISTLLGLGVLEVVL